MDLESLGGGVGSGLIGTILGLLGFSKIQNRRIDKLEDNKQDKFACIPTHKGIEDKFNTIISSVNEIKDVQSKMWDKLNARRREFGN